ncbi:MAG: hypothetical protein JRH11_27175, partial [Deltaproteobacteria bacterium]|nr:hypothetical protein [Deltaproteobacteria bacterium]
MHPLLVIVLTALTALGLGCEGDPQPLGWELEFSDSALLDRAVVVEAVIFEGGCGGEEIFSTEILQGEDSVAVAPHLADGRWAFGGRARDAGCVTFAEGCAEVTLPAAGPVVVMLSVRATEVPACPSSRCSAGQCLDVPVDAGSTDACMATETNCTDGIDDDCNGDIDCDDTACVGEAVCAACASVTCGPCEVCRGGDCFTVEDETSCGTGTCWGGSCCAGCWDGISCRLGDADTNCGNDGALCTSCEGCGSCGDGACMAGVGTEGTACAAGNGVCAMGVCCTRCTVDGVCVAGNTPAACGVGGGSCRGCAECASCLGGACTPADGPECPGGICHVGACCTGCWG